MERKTLNELLKWKEKKNRKPLLLTGVRQCGKTYIIKEFGKKEFEDTAYFNFDGNTGLQSVFDFDFDVGRIVDELANVVYETRLFRAGHWLFLMRSRIVRVPYSHLSIFVKICRNFMLLLRVPCLA